MRPIAGKIRTYQKMLGQELTYAPLQRLATLYDLELRNFPGRPRLEPFQHLESSRSNLRVRLIDNRVDLIVFFIPGYGASNSLIAGLDLFPNGGRILRSDLHRNLGEPDQKPRLQSVYHLSEQDALSFEFFGTADRHNPNQVMNAILYRRASWNPVRP